MFLTAAFGVLPELFPKNVATVMVRVFFRPCTEALTASSFITLMKTEGIVHSENLGVAVFPLWFCLLKGGQELLVEQVDVF